MKYILDSSVALKWVLPEADSAKAIQLLDDYQNAIHELLSPDIFNSEIANGLASAERQGRIKKGEAGSFFNVVVRQSPLIVSASPCLVRAIDLAVATRQAVYDCTYLAMAEAEGCEMVSADEAFIKKMHVHFPFLIRLSDLT